MSQAGVGHASRTATVVAVCAAASYLGFTIAVHVGALDPFDLLIRNLVRPRDVWGPDEVRAARVVHDLRPGLVVASLFLVTAGLSLLRRSLRPLLAVVVVGVPAAAVTVGSKWLMGTLYDEPTPDYHSFPSGHMLTVVVAVGLVVLLLRPATRWGWLLPFMTGVGMGAALIVAWVHPATDVIGGGLLAATALCCARAVGLGGWARRPVRRGEAVPCAR